MIRARFKVPGDDGRPMSWPVALPFWTTGYGDDCTIVVAYASGIEELTDDSHWPDAYEIDHTPATEIVYTDRFRKPEWMK